MLPGHYGTAGAYTINLPEDMDIPDILKPFLNEKIKVHLSIDGPGVCSEVICVETKIKTTD